MLTLTFTAHTLTQIFNLVTAILELVIFIAAHTSQPDHIIVKVSVREYFRSDSGFGEKQLWPIIIECDLCIKTYSICVLLQETATRDEQEVS